MADPAADKQFLQRALELARQGIGQASPNPHVGAVIVDAQGQIAGTGTYTYQEVKHAEIRALEQAGKKARGGTLYINLEPHAHQGRTRPCTEALIAAGIRRVVASMEDPNPRVSGRGFEQLRTAGVEVVIGGLRDEARKLNEAFARYIRHGVPLVTLKSAMTLDGKIGGCSHTAADEEIAANENAGDAQAPRGGWITGEAARRHVHEQRHASDAILAGVGTVAADDPRLTDRSGKSRRRRLSRVILDSQLRIPLQSRLVKSADQDVLIFYSSAADAKKKELIARGICVEQIAGDAEGRVNLPAVMRRLAEREITSVMIEGGSRVNGAALAAGVVDKVFLYYAPKLLGQAGSTPFAEGSVPREPLRIHNVQMHRFGDDVAIEGYLRDPYGE